MSDEITERKPPKLFHSKKMDEKHRKHFNSLIRRNAKGGDHFTTIHYIKPDGSRENKEVKPYTAKKSKDGKYLLVGYAKDRGEVRSYRTDRIHHIKEASMFWQGFEKRAGLEVLADPAYRKKIPGYLANEAKATVKHVADNVHKYLAGGAAAGSAYAIHKANKLEKKMNEGHS